MGIFQFFIDALKESINAKLDEIEESECKPRFVQLGNIIGTFDDWRSFIDGL